MMLLFGSEIILLKHTHFTFIWQALHASCILLLSLCWNFSAFSVCACAALLSFHAFCLWSKTDLMRGGKQWKPQRAWSYARQRPASATSSTSDTYLPCVQASLSHIHTHTDTHTPTQMHTTPEITPLGSESTVHTLAFTEIQTFSQLRSNRQTKKEDLLLHRHPPSFAFICCVCVFAKTLTNMA